MLDAATQAVAFVHGKQRRDLDDDLQLNLALTRLVENPRRGCEERVGYRATASPRGPLARYCRNARPTRTRLFDVDLDLLWQIVSADLVALIPTLESALTDPNWILDFRK
jgi:hypothetical protein